MNGFRFSLFFFATAWLSLSTTATFAKAPFPNIVLFLVDDLGWRDLGCYGSEFYETPAIDRFASASVRFTEAYAACHVCSPTRASIVTGKHPARLHLTDWLPGRKDFSFQRLKNVQTPQQLPLAEITIAEALREHGYRTAHIGKWHLGEDPYGPLQQGFDLQIPNWNKGWPKAGYLSPFEMDQLESKPGDYLTDRLTDEAENFMAANPDQPFFLYMSHFAVHDPIEGRGDLVSKYQQKAKTLDRPRDPAYVLEGNPDSDHTLSRRQLDSRLHDSRWSGYRVLPDRMIKVKQHQDNVQFAAMVESMDQSLDRLLSKLDRMGIADNTIVILFSDNGGMSCANFGNPNRVVNRDSLDRAFATSNSPLRGGKGWLYEGGIRVPMIIHWPGHGQRGTVCEIPVMSTDLYPTILEMAGLASMPKQHLDGASIASLVDGSGEIDREALYWHFPHYSNHGMQSPGGAIRAGDYKLLEYFENGSIELFNLRDDAGEQVDLSETEPALATRLRQMLHRWRLEVSAQLMTENPQFEATESNPQ